MNNSDENRFSQKDVDSIKQLIYNSPTVKIPLYRGVKGTNEILNLKKGDDVPLFDINSFSSEEDKAQCFAKGRTPVIFVIDKPCKALNIQPLSTYYDEEAEYFVGNGYKVDKIENNKDIFGTKGTYITISPKEEIK